MSPGKTDNVEPLAPVTAGGQPTPLVLAEHEVVIRKNGVEFLSQRPLPLWTEVTVDLQSPQAPRPLRGNGVVVDCTGTRQTGYTIAVLMLGLSSQSQQHLQQLALTLAS